MIVCGADREDDRGNVVWKTEMYWWITVTSRVVMECYMNHCKNDEQLTQLGMIGCADKKDECWYRKQGLSK